MVEEAGVFSSVSKINQRISRLTAVFCSGGLKDGNAALNVSDLARNIALYLIHGSVVFCAVIVLPIFVMDSGD